MTSLCFYLQEGGRIFFSSWKNRFFTKHYSGKAKEICQQIVKECWNGTFFQTSTQNFAQFWTRDFGWCTEALMKLEYDTEVRKTLKYALEKFQEAQKITTTITPSGKAFDFPTFAVDSLPWLIHSIKLAKFNYNAYKPFLNQEIERFFQLVINPQTGLVKPEGHFSSMKDFAIRKSSCYDNCLVALLAQDLSEMKGLLNPFQNYNYPDLIKRHFWNEKYFYDDLSKQDYIAGDANVFPFALGIINDKEMLKTVIESIKEAELDQPFPLKYTADREKIKFIGEEIFLRNYESDSIWTHMGPLYIKLVGTVDKSLAKEYKLKYKEMIEKYGNYLEVFDGEGKPFSTPFYYCDAGMLWAANYLGL